jgi:hypothetical protein
MTVNINHRLHTVSISFPGLDNGVRNRLPIDRQDTALNIHIIALAFRSYRVTELDYAMSDEHSAMWTLHSPSGASSVKNGPRTLLSIAPLIGGLLRASTKADTPRVSDSKMNS